VCVVGIIEELIGESLSPSFEWKTQKTLFSPSLMRFLFLLISSYGGEDMNKNIETKVGWHFPYPLVQGRN